MIYQIRLAPLCGKSQQVWQALNLDRRADFELQHGHHAEAERLSRRAAELREGAR